MKKQHSPTTKLRRVTSYEKKNQVKWIKKRKGEATNKGGGTLRIGSGKRPPELAKGKECTTTTFYTKGKKKKPPVGGEKGTMLVKKGAQPTQRKEKERPAPSRKGERTAPRFLVLNGKKNKTLRKKGVRTVAYTKPAQKGGKRGRPSAQKKNRWLRKRRGGGACTTNQRSLLFIFKGGKAFDRKGGEAGVTHPLKKKKEKGRSCATHRGNNSMKKKKERRSPDRKRRRASRRNNCDQVYRGSYYPKHPASGRGPSKKNHYEKDLEKWPS